MSIEYLGLSEINGPLIALEGVQNASYEEIVEITVDGNKKELGRIIECYKDKAVIQVFGGTDNMSLRNTHTKLTGHPWRLPFPGDPGPYLQWYRTAYRRSGRDRLRYSPECQRTAAESGNP